MDDKIKNEDGKKLDEMATLYLKELHQELTQLSDSSPHAAKLLQAEIGKTIEAGKRKREAELLDVYNDRVTKINAKVRIPTDVVPPFNFVGKLLGPKGNTLRRIQEETQCRLSILGRGSLKDRSKEEQLRKDSENVPKYAHLFEDLHVGVSTLAPPAEAYARIAYALAEIQKYLVPDSPEDVAQRREMAQYMQNMDDMDMGNGYIPEQSPGLLANPRAPPIRGVRGGRGGRGGGGFAPRGASQSSFSERPGPRPAQGSFGGARPERGGFGGARPDRGGFGGARPERGGFGGARPERGGFGGARPERNDYNMGSNNSFGGYDGRVVREEEEPYSNVNYDCQQDEDYEETSYVPEGVHRRPMVKPREVADPGRGRWKQRGGNSRFAERSLPYTRR